MLHFDFMKFISANLCSFYQYITFAFYWHAGMVHPTPGNSAKVRGKRFNLRFDPATLKLGPLFRGKPKQNQLSKGVHMLGVTHEDVVLFPSLAIPGKSSGLG